MGEILRFRAARRAGSRRQWFRRRLLARRGLLYLVFGLVAALALFPRAPDPVSSSGIQIIRSGVVTSSSSGHSDITCTRPRIIDGDTFDCAGTRIRLHSIDAPEMPGHCREGRRCTAGDPHAAKDFLTALTRADVSCARVDTDRYGRTIARCRAGGQDLSCAMVAAGHAVERYGRLQC